MEKNADILKKVYVSLLFSGDWTKRGRKLQPSLTPTAAQCVTAERLFLRRLVVISLCALVGSSVKCLHRQLVGRITPTRRQEEDFVNRNWCVSVFQECRDLAEYERGNFADVCPCQKCWPEKGKLCFPTLTLQQTNCAAQVLALVALQMQGHELMKLL